MGHGWPREFGGLLLRMTARRAIVGRGSECIGVGWQAELVVRRADQAAGDRTRSNPQPLPPHTVELPSVDSPGCGPVDESVDPRTRGRVMGAAEDWRTFAAVLATMP